MQRFVSNVRFDSTSIKNKSIKPSPTKGLIRRQEHMSRTWDKYDNKPRARINWQTKASLEGRAHRTSTQGNLRVTNKVLIMMYPPTRGWTDRTTWCRWRRSKWPTRKHGKRPTPTGSGFRKTDGSWSSWTSLRIRVSQKESKSGRFRKKDFPRCCDEAWPSWTEEIWSRLELLFVTFYFSGTKLRFLRKLKILYKRNSGPWLHFGCMQGFQATFWPELFQESGKILPQQ